MPKPPANSTPVTQKPLLFILLISLAFNAYAWQRSALSPAKEALASVGPQKMTLDDFDPSTHVLLKYRAESWAQNQILLKEAALHSMTPKQLLQKEVYSKVTVAPEAVYERYVHSPAADKVGWPQGSKSIENELRNQRASALKDGYLRNLYPKYQVHFFLKTPAGSGKETLTPGNFPVYVAPPAADTGLAPPSRGPVQAPVVIEVYSDFLCPFSHRFFGTLQQLSAQYPDKLRIVFRHFPLPMHTGSHRMSEAAVCAQQQGKFWEFHDKMMAGDPLKRDDAALKQLASEVGLDAAKFQSCFASGRVKSRVDQDIALGKKNGVQSTPSFLINGRRNGGAMPPETVKTYIDWYLNPQGAYPGTKPSAAGGGGCSAPNANAKAAPPVDPNRVYTFDEKWLQSGPAQGPEKAPVTLVEFYDYNCPFCRKGAGTIDELLKRHPGQIRVHPKYFPLSMHPNAMKTAEAAACADDQGKFWEYRQEVFGDSWGKNNPDDLKAIAKKVGLKEQEFNACLDGDKTKERVDQDMKAGMAAGVHGTPGFFLNGKFLNGAQPVESFEALLTSEQQAYT